MTIAGSLLCSTNLRRGRRISGWVDTSPPSRREAGSDITSIPMHHNLSTLVAGSPNHLGSRAGHWQKEKKPGSLSPRPVPDRNGFPRNCHHCYNSPGNGRGHGTGGSGADEAEVVTPHTKLLAVWKIQEDESAPRSVFSRRPSDEQRLQHRTDCLPSVSSAFPDYQRRLRLGSEQIQRSSSRTLSYCLTARTITPAPLYCTPPKTGIFLAKMRTAKPPCGRVRCRWAATIDDHCPTSGRHPPRDDTD